MNYTKKILAVTAIVVFGLSLISLAVPARATTDSSAWTLSVLSPTPFEVVTTSVLPLHVFANNYQLDPRYAGTPNLPTIGHYHEILDGRLIDMAPTPDPQHDTISMVGVTRGPHVLTIVPARNDHSMILASAVMVPFTYEGPFLPQPTCISCNGPATINIVPRATNFVRGNSFTLTVNVQNFLFSNLSFGKELIAGVGHWHVFLDQPMMANMLTMASADSQQVYLTGVTPGVHTFYAVLVNNQHMPFMVMNPDGTMGMAQGTLAAITLNVNPVD